MRYTSNNFISNNFFNISLFHSIPKNTLLPQLIHISTPFMPPSCLIYKFVKNDFGVLKFILL